MSQKNCLPWPAAIGQEQKTQHFVKIFSNEYFRVALREKKLSCGPFSSEGVCECSRCEHILVFHWDQRGLLFLGIPNLLVGDIYHVKNEGCLLEVFIMMLFNRTLSKYDNWRINFIFYLFIYFLFF